ncbi:hypothetical protein [Streptomyces radicis]|uniref:Uncharacterized protein n=1 Tax=Streptomyces radicis TaxID=1750517 RepID=A0A3A9WJB7_9ACTN|nr:hypothetical protein [Streptomyces radicis]RKN07836.1 hypothetical protein D7319_17310 [Streptomyces radicis]RKN20710.1 hypothetical protein D7318_17610 [Streptomyces radicis]
MPHPTPVQIAYGSATVISITLVSLFVVDEPSVPATAAIAVVALLIGAFTALAPWRRPAARRPAVAVTASATRAEPAPAAAPRPSVRA